MYTLELLNEVLITIFSIHRMQWPEKSENLKQGISSHQNFSTKIKNENKVTAK